MSAIEGPLVIQPRGLHDTSGEHPCELTQVPRLKALSARIIALNNLPVISADTRSDSAIKSDRLSKTEEDDTPAPLLDGAAKQMLDDQKAGVSYSLTPGDREERYVQIFKDRVVSDYDDGSKKPRPAIVISTKREDFEQSEAGQVFSKPVILTHDTSILGGLKRGLTTGKSFFQTVGLMAREKKSQTIDEFSAVDENALMDLINIGFYEGTLKKDNETFSMLLSLAARDNKYQIAKKLLEEIDVDVNWLDANKLSPMMYAALNGNLELIESLKRAEADPNQACSVGLFNLMKMMLSKNRSTIDGLLSRLLSLLMDDTKYYIEKYPDEIYESLDDEFLFKILNDCRDDIMQKLEMSPEELIAFVKDKLQRNDFNLKSLEKLIPVLINIAMKKIPKDVISDTIKVFFGWFSHNPSTPRINLSPVLMAAISGNHQAVLSLITGKTKAKEIQMVLLIAAALGATSIIQGLMRKKLVDINSQRFFLGITPLMLATLMQKNETVKFLLANNARFDLYPDLNFLDDALLYRLSIPTTVKQIKLSSAAIAFALAPGLNNFELMELYKQHGADFSVLNDEDELKVLALFIGSYVLERNQDTLDYLLSQGIDINTSASRLYNLTLFYLLNLGLNINVQAVRNKTSSQEFLEKSLKHILQVSDDPNFKENSLEIISLVITSIAFMLNANGRRKQRESYTDMLLTRNAEIDCRETLKGTTPLMTSLILGDIEMAEILLKKGANPDSRTHTGETALHLLAFGPFELDVEYKKEAMQLLLKYGANPDLRCSMGRTPIIRCVGEVELVKILLEAGADPGIEDNNGDSALHWAAFQGSDEAFELILNNEVHPVDMNLKNADGDTALSLATQKDQVNKVRMLLEKQNKSRVSLSLALAKIRDYKRQIVDRGENIRYTIQNNRRKIQAVCIASITSYLYYYLYNHPGIVNRFMNRYFTVWNQDEEQL